MTYTLGLNEQVLDQIDVLTAIRPSEVPPSSSSEDQALVDEQMLSVTKVEVDPENQEETKIEEIVGKMPTTSADRAREEI